MNLLSKEQVILNDHLSAKEPVIRMIAEKATELGLSDDCEELIASFMEREALGITGMGGGIAIPHAKSSSVKRVAVIIVKSETPIVWESFDEEPVYIAIALMVPKENPDNVHLKVLSSLTRKLVNEQFKKSLFNANTQNQIMALFENISLGGTKNE